MTNGDPHAIYGRCYELDETKDHAYRMAPGRQQELRTYFQRIRKEDPQSETYAGVSCGHGECLDIAEAHGFRALGFELPTVVPYRESRAEILAMDDITAIPTSDTFDVVGCHDVLEHIPDSKIDQAIAELWRITGRRLHLSVCTKEEIWGPTVEGLGQLHVCVHPDEWWSETLERITGAKPVMLPGRHKPHFVPIEVVRP